MSHVRSSPPNKKLRISGVQHSFVAAGHSSGAVNAASTPITAPPIGICTSPAVSHEINIRHINITYIKELLIFKGEVTFYQPVEDTTLL
jgi:hypothetical protein